MHANASLSFHYSKNIPITHSKQVELIMASPQSNPANPPMVRRSGRVNKKKPPPGGAAKKAVAKTGSRKRAVKAKKPVTGAGNRGNRTLQDLSNSVEPTNRPPAGLKDDSEALQSPGMPLRRPNGKQNGKLMVSFSKCYFETDVVQLLTTMVILFTTLQVFLLR
jgi:hypothetical protein